MKFEDEEVMDDGAVRSFVVTGGRATADPENELSLETLVEPNHPASETADMQFERRAIVTSLSGPTSIAEIAAELALPLLSTQVLVSDLVSEGILTAHESVSDVNFDVLQSIRNAIVNL